MPSSLFLCLAAALPNLPAWVQRAEPSDAIVLSDVHVVDVERGVILRDQALALAGGRIERIGPARGFPGVPGARVIEGRGRYLIPGLFDMHVHLNEEDSDEALLLYVANGVTTVQSMHGGPHQLRLRERVRRGELVAPRILTTGPTTAQLGVHSVEQARQAVSEQQAAGYDGVKMYGDGADAMPRETYHALVSAAHAAGLRVVGHAARNLPFSAVLEERQDSIDHMEEIVYTDEGLARVVRPYVELQFGRKSFADHPELLAEVPNFAARLEQEIAGLAARVKAAGLHVTPTLITFATIQRTTDDQFFELAKKPELRYVPPARRLEWAPERARFRNGGWKTQLSFMAAYLERHLELQEALLRAFHAAGVPLMAGTDSPFDFVVQGFALHDELELFARAGLSPLEALRSATLVPARFLGLAEDSGSIEAGKRADLVLVEGDPLADVGAARRVAGVCLAGRWLGVEELGRELDALASRQAELTPIVEGIAQALEAGRLAEALALYRSAPAGEPGLARFLEQRVNALGYRLLNEGRLDAALQAMQQNSEVFPRSLNAWDSLGEVLWKRGESEAAIAAYERVLELEPSNGNARAMIDRIVAAGE